jgi:hypothetical protein
MFRTARSVAIVLALAGLTSFPAQAQEADPTDVATVDAIVTAVYDVISGAAGEARDWDRWRSLFIEDARLIPVGRTPEGAVRHSVMTPEDYVQGSGAFLEENGFFEVEVGRVMESFGQIAHLFSTYESRRTEADAEPFARGINSFQLLNDGTRWWVVSIMWDSERPENPIPSRYIGR